MKCLIALSLGTFLFVAGAPTAPIRAQDMANLQGAWKVIGAENKGEKVPPDELQDLEMVFGKDDVTVLEAGKTQDRLSFRLDWSQDPKSIDFTYNTGRKKGRTDRAIYEIEGDTLRFCIQENKEEPRPSTFNTSADKDLSLIILKRSEP